MEPARFGGETKPGAKFTISHVDDQGKEVTSTTVEVDRSTVILATAAAAVAATFTMLGATYFSRTLNPPRNPGAFKEPEEVD